MMGSMSGCIHLHMDTQTLKNIFVKCRYLSFRGGDGFISEPDLWDVRDASYGRDG